MKIDNGLHNDDGFLYNQLRFLNESRNLQRVYFYFGLIKLLHTRHANRHMYLRLL